MNTRHQVYESIGVGYASARRPDPPIHLLIVDALGDARTVLNVGAGGGNYEPSERSVIAVEPSLKMISQRRYGSGPALQGVAEACPSQTSPLTPLSLLLPSTIGPTFQRGCWN